MIATVLKLLARRLLAAVPILLVVSAILFGVLRLLPVDPAAMSLPPTATIEEVEAKRREMGLDQPLLAAIPDLAQGRAARRFRPLDPLSPGIRIAGGGDLARNDRAGRPRHGAGHDPGYRRRSPPVQRAGHCARARYGHGVDPAAFDPGIPLGADPAVPVRRDAAVAAVYRASLHPACRNRTSRASCCSTPCWSGASTFSRAPGNT